MELVLYLSKKLYHSCVPMYLGYTELTLFVTLNIFCSFVFKPLKCFSLFDGSSDLQCPVQVVLS